MANETQLADHSRTIDGVLASIPRRIAPFGSSGIARGDMMPGKRFLPIYYGDGELWYVHDMETGKAAQLPPAPPPPEKAGPPAPFWVEIDKLAETEAHRHRVVYFIGTLETAIKIGTSYSAADRFKTIQAHSPVALNILAVRQGGEIVEGAYHQWFAEHRLHGEWFNPAPELLAEIERLRSMAYRSSGKPGRAA